MGLPRYVIVSILHICICWEINLWVGIWKIIKGWLDPVVAAKVNFTNNVKDMEEFIASSRLLKELEGEEDWEYKYIEPIPGENDKMKDSETRDRLLADREKLVKEFEQATLEWIQEDEANPATKAKREQVATSLKHDYWNLDPYIRARSLYDRLGVIQPGGKINFYPKPNSEAIVNGTQPAETTADDVD
jgi:hypothetical protein